MKNTRKAALGKEIQLLRKNMPERLTAKDAKKCRKDRKEMPFRIRERLP
jgi:hypothetical protein